ncbi:MAG TPA: hypothetical protein VGA37_02765 [Gemmatimonadales bacterium]
MTSRIAVLSILTIWILADPLTRHAAPHQTQVHGLLVRRADLTTVVRLAPNGAVTDTIYRSSALHVFDLTVAPSGRFVAMLEGGGRAGTSNRLIVADGVGNTIHVVERDVRRHVWCCDGSQVAFITGSFAEGGDLGFTPTGAYLIDIERGTEERLDVPSDVYELAWVAFDTALYFKTSRGYPGSSIVRYHPNSRKSVVTAYLDLRFSPSGTFYLHQFPDAQFGSPGWRIFERATGRQVARPDTSLGGIEGWVFGEGDYLRLKRVRFPMRDGMRRGPEEIVGYTIYDVAAGGAVVQIRDSVRADIVSQLGALVLARDGRLELVRSVREIVRP